MAGDVAMDSGGGGGERPVIIDGLLCSILRAMSRVGASAELASVIEKNASEDEVKTAWVKLFTHFKEAIDPTRKKKVIEIVRETTKGRINDILTQLRKLDIENEDSELLLMPWNYIIKQFESESEERRMDKKHNELLAAFRGMLNELDVGKKTEQISFTVPCSSSSSAWPSQCPDNLCQSSCSAPKVTGTWWWN